MAPPVMSGMNTDEAFPAAARKLLLIVSEQRAGLGVRDENGLPLTVVDEHASSRHGGGARRDPGPQIFDASRTTAGNDGDAHTRSDLTEGLKVITIHRTITVDAVEKDFTSSGSRALLRRFQ